jgi:hypothetical protein
LVSAIKLTTIYEAFICSGLLKSTKKRSQRPKSNKY